MPKLHNGIVYGQLHIIPVVLIDATNYVYKCITSQATTISIWVSFNDILLCKYFGFSFAHVTSPHVGYVLYGGALSSNQKETSFY